jgi:single-stranded DNA-binding protein
MLEVLMSGRLIRDPATRTGPSGKPFTTALLRVQTDGNDGEGMVASCIAFGETGERLGRLRAGDAASVSGPARLTQWQKDGETRHGLNVTVQAVLSAYDARSRRDPAESTGNRSGGTRVEPGGTRPRPPGRQAHASRAGSGRTGQRPAPGGGWEAYGPPGDGAPFSDDLGF